MANKQRLKSAIMKQYGPMVWHRLVLGGPWITTECQDVPDAAQVYKRLLAAGVCDVLASAKIRKAAGKDITIGRSCC